LSIELPIYRKDGSELDQKLVIDNPAFTIEPSDHAIYLAVKTEMANARQGTHATKTRAEVRGGGKKPWRQKGTGRARAGSRRSPIWVGGGRVFGPKPHDYDLKINRKLKKLARQSALTYRFQEGAVKVVEDFNLTAPKAKEIRNLLKNLGLEGKRISILTSELSDELILACRNFYNILLVEAAKASTYDILDCEVLLIDRAGLEKLNNALLNAN
jgi:large subunit ribosomal protein L4